MMITTDEKKKEVELCVRCGKPTPYEQSTSITLRHYFIEGAGQLCEECWDVWEKLWPIPEFSHEKGIFTYLKNLSLRS